MIVPKNLDSRVNCFWTFSSEKRDVFKFTAEKSCISDQENGEI